MARHPQRCDVCALTANYGSWGLLLAGAVLSLLPVAPWLAALAAYLMMLGLGVQLARTAYLLVKWQSRLRS